jgi:protein-S-isoprenylcysteine O-methyltransferase Ste14
MKIYKMKLNKTWIKTNWQLLLDIYLFLNFLGWSGWQVYKAIHQQKLDFVEVSFIFQNLILTTLILIRKPYKSIDKNIFNQAIASIAFFSGALFMGQPETTNKLFLNISTVVIFISNILGVLTLINLGRSFGILIAFRKLKTNGLYSIVRHPMYGTDILLRIGFIISHITVFSIIAFIVSTACYIYRAMLEEKFLSTQSNYGEYMKKVKYRFIPFVF